MLDEETKKQIKEVVLKVVREYNTTSAFIDKKLTDTPTDNFSLVNRRFVTLSSNIGARPISSVAVTGQHFFSTTTNTPIVFDGNNWRNGVGSVVASGSNSYQ